MAIGVTAVASSASAAASPPAAPSVTDTAAGNGSVALTWSTPANNGAAITGYKVYRGTSSGSLSLLASTGVVNTFTSTGLTNGTTYYFAVSAVNSRGEGSKSPTTSAVPATVPAAPPLATPTVTTTSASLSWSVPSANGSAVTGYKVYRGLTSTGLSLVGNSSVPSYNDGDLTSGTTYYYAVSAVNAQGEGPQSSVVSAVPAGPPSAPSLSPITVGSGSATLTWTTPAANGAAVTGYKIYRGTSSTNLSPLATISPANTYTSAGLTNGTTYYFAVAATNAKGEGAKSSVEQGVPGAPPSAPVLSTPTVGATNSLTLNWTIPANNGAPITGYEVYRGTSSSSLSLIATLGTVTTFTNTGLNGGTTYFYAVSAVNARGTGARSAVQSAVPTGKPDAPIVATPTTGNGTSALQWSTPASNGLAITAYKVYRGTSSSSLSLRATLGTATTYNDSGLVNGTTYYYAVSAVNSKGEGDQSTVVSAVPATVPNAPTLAVPTGGAGSASLSWTPPANTGGSPIVGYKIFQGPSSSSLALVDTIGVTTTYQASGLTNGSAYHFAVVAVNAKGDSVKSNVGSATPTAPPAAPVVSLGDVGDEVVSMTWTTPAANGAPITGYKVYRAASASTLTEIATVGLVNSYEFRDLANGATYYFAAVAINARGESVKSNLVTAAPAGPPLRPTVSSCAGGNSSVTIGWAPAADNGSPVTGYQVFAGTAASSLNLVGTVGPTTSFTKSGLQNGTTYHFAVAASNAEGVGPVSTAVSCVAASVPSAPVLSTVVPNAGSATLTWTSPGGNGAAITNYRIYRGTSSSNLTLLTTVGQTNSYTSTGLTNGTMYYFAVRAVNSTGDSAASNVVSATPSATTTTTTSTTTIPTSTTSLPPGNVNDPKYWSDLGYGTCTKNDNPSTPYVLANPPSGYVWTLLVLKAGSESSNSDWLTQIPNPQPGTYYHPSGKQLSHVISCKKPQSATTTTATTTTTVVGSGCDSYTPTNLTMSDASAEPGQAIVISGSGVPNDNLKITIKGPGQPEAIIGYAVIDGLGNFSVSVIIPDSYPPGSYTITVRSRDCECEAEQGTTTTQPIGNDDDDDGDDDDSSSSVNRNSSNDDDDGGNDDDDGGNGGGSPCDGATTLTISVTSLDLTGCGTNSYDRVFSPGETTTWHLMGSPFQTSSPPVTLTLVSRTPGGPSYTLYSGVYPPSLDVSVTIPAAAPTDRYYLNQTGKKNGNKTITKSCPVRIGIDAILVSSSSDLPMNGSRSIINLGMAAAGIFLLSVLRIRRSSLARR